MFTSRKKFTALFVASLSLLTLTAVGVAQKHFMMAAPRPEVKVQLSAMVERDRALVPLEKAAAVKPGEILNWTITSENSGNASALEYKAVGHIPRGTEFVAANAGGARAVYSIDNGKSFYEKPMIDEKQPNGTIKRVAAPLGIYTDVRYEWSDPLAQNEKLSASYKVRVK